MNTEEYFTASLAKVRDQRSALMQAKEVNASPEELRRLSRAFFDAASRVLLLYSHPKNWPAEKTVDPFNEVQTPDIPLPSDIAWIAGGLFEHISKGDIAGPIQDALGSRGQAKAGGFEARDTKTAALYVLLARRGEIDDPEPIKTICEEFEVNPRTAQTWVTKYPTVDLDPLISRPADKVPAAMRSAAERYQIAGPGQKAVDRRVRRARQ